jgi:hypothetical protein
MEEEPMADYESLRRTMVRHHLAARGVEDRRVLDAMGSVPREAFIPENLAEFAYEDTPLPIEEGQTISQPYIVAAMAEALELGPGDRVLEIGAGSPCGSSPWWAPRAGPKRGSFRSKPSCRSKASCRPQASRRR